MTVLSYIACQSFGFHVYTGWYYKKDSKDIRLNAHKFHFTPHVWHANKTRTFKTIQLNDMLLWNLSFTKNIFICHRFNRNSVTKSIPMLYFWNTVLKQWFLFNFISLYRKHITKRNCHPEFNLLLGCRRYIFDSWLSHYWWTYKLLW